MPSKVDVWNDALDNVQIADEIESETATSVTAKKCRRHWDRVVRACLEVYPWGWATRQRPIVELGTQTKNTAGDDARVKFEFEARYLDPAQVAVSLVEGGVATEQTSGTHYTLTDSVNGLDPFVTFATAPTSSQSVRITVTTSREGWGYIYGLPHDYVRGIGLLLDDTRYEMYGVENRIPHVVRPNDAGNGYILCCDLRGSDIAQLEYVALLDYVPMWSAAFRAAVAWGLAEPLAHSIKKDTKLAAFCREMWGRSLSEAAAYDQNEGYHPEPETPGLAVRG